MKTSEPGIASSTRHVTSCSHAAEETSQKAPAIRWKAKDTSEARLYVRQMHRRIPAWKLKLCTEALNARPIDLMRITEVAEIEFVTEDLVDVAAQCLADIAKEIEPMNHAVGDTGAAPAVPPE